MCITFSCWFQTFFASTCRLAHIHTHAHAHTLDMPPQSTLLQESSCSLCPASTWFLKPCFSISISSRNPKNVQKSLRNPLPLRNKWNIKWNTSIYLSFMYVTCKKWNHMTLKCVVTFLWILTTFQKIQNSDCWNKNQNGTHHAYWTYF